LTVVVNQGLDDPRVAQGGRPDQLARFGVVGLTAASVHFSIVVILVQNELFVPLVANIVAFLISFQVSYWGHRRFTFPGSVTQHREAYSKLVFLQLANLAANEGSEAMNQENSSFAKRWLQAPFFSARGYVSRAVLISLVFAVCHFLGWRELTTFLSGSTASPDMSIKTSGTMGVVYMLTYFGFVLAVPVLLIGAGLVSFFERFFTPTNLPPS
jgi:hypothetical protein